MEVLENMLQNFPQPLPKHPVDNDTDARKTEAVVVRRWSVIAEGGGTESGDCNHHHHHPRHRGGRHRGRTTAAADSGMKSSG